MDANLRSFGNNEELSLLGVPSVQALLAGSWHDAKAAQTWVAEAMGPEVPKEGLRGPRALMRLDMMIATHLIEQFPNVKRNRNLSLQRTHFLSRINHVEHSCQIEGRVLTDRAMIRAICVWLSVRSENGRHWICRDLFRMTIDRRKPNRDV
eukprot:4554579-Pyramimonas_sp.AAC.1